MKYYLTILMFLPAGLTGGAQAERVVPAINEIEPWQQVSSLTK